MASKSSNEASMKDGPRLVVKPRSRTPSQNSREHAEFLNSHDAKADGQIQKTCR
jgi:hypothetical protein